MDNNIPDVSFNGNDFIPREYPDRLAGLNQQYAKSNVNETRAVNQRAACPNPPKQKETTMKTGRDTICSGLYVSECCQKERHFVKGHMLPRCPRCYSLTVWEIKEQEAENRNENQPTQVA